METSRPISKTVEDLESMVAYWDQVAADSIRREVELKGKFIEATGMLIDATAKLNAIQQIHIEHGDCDTPCDALLLIAEVLDRE